MEGWLKKTFGGWLTYWSPVVFSCAAGAILGFGALQVVRNGSGSRHWGLLLVLLFLIGFLGWMVGELKRDPEKDHGDSFEMVIRLGAVLGLVGGLLMEVDLLRHFLFRPGSIAHIWSLGDAAWPRVTGAVGVALVLAIVILATLYALVEVIRGE